MGIIDKLFGKKQEAAPAPISVPQKPKEIKKLRPFPFSVGEANLRYAYDKEAEDMGTLDEVLGDAEKVVDVTTDGEYVVYTYEGQPFARTRDQRSATMVNDFFRRGDPVNAVLRQDKTISLRFYRDMRPLARESEVVQLTAFKSKACQERLECMDSGTELGFDLDSTEVYEFLDFFTKQQIGKLPAKIVKRADEDEIIALYLEEVKEEATENDEYEDVVTYIPFVRVYWR